jgi:hypothetical protein
VRIPLLLNALWRFRVVVGAGILLATALAFLSYYQVSFAGGIKLTPRESETWSSQSTLFVTQEGFPWGRTYLESKITIEGAAPTALGDPGRFQGLAVLYAELANSDEVHARMMRGGPIEGTLEAVPVVPPVESPPLPLIRLAATSDSPQGAIAVAQRYTRAFRAFITEEQDAADIPADQRVRLEVTQQASKPELLAGRGLTLPLMVFISVMCAVAGLVFVLENLRPSPVQALRPERLNGHAGGHAPELEDVTARIGERAPARDRMG